MNNIRILAWSVLALVFFWTAGEARSESEPEPFGTEPTGPVALDGHREANGSAGSGNDLPMEGEITLQTAYFFRGMNVFQYDEQLDQHAILGTNLAVSFGESGLYAGHWSAWQLNGPNVFENGNDGIGGEQELFLGYDVDLTDELNIASCAGIYFYPFAQERIWSYLDVALEAIWSTLVDTGILVALFHGFPRDSSDQRYLYLALKAGKEFDLGEKTMLGIYASMGRKVFEPYLEVEDNLWDIEAGADLAYSFDDTVQGSLLVRFAWTNLTDMDFSEEIGLWFGITIGASG